MIQVEGFPSPSGPLDLRIARGEVVLLEGPNGSGKSSLLRALAGLPAPLAPERATVDGADPRRLDARRLRAVAHLAAQDPRDGLVGLTVTSEFRLRDAPVPVAMAAVRHRDVATLSSGEARRVGLAVATAQSAPLLLLDEPAEGLDCEGREWLLRLVEAARSKGAVVAADHSGLLAGLASRRVALGPTDGAAQPAWGPVPAAGVHVSSESTEMARGPRRITLPGVSLGPGFHAVTGPNGSGKSTLLLHLAGLLGPGPLVDGRPPTPGRDARLLLPRARDLFTAPTVAAELRGTDSAVHSAFVPPGLDGRHPLTLSGGEAQRVALAKCLGRPAPVYLLDEPEAHFDRAGRAALLANLASLRKAGACIVAATHDSDLIGAADSRTALEACR